MSLYRSALLFSALALSAAAQSGADLARQIRAAELDQTECYRVRDLSLPKEDLHLYLNDGYLIFAKPVNGERWAAVFSADVEGGDGEVLLLPPYRGERKSLAKFTQSPNLDEHFIAAVMLFTDGSGEQLHDQIFKNGRGRKIPELGPVLAKDFGPVLANIEDGFELRLARDLLTPRPSRRGLLFATLGGKALGNFDVFYDARAGEQILAGRMAEHASRLTYDIWTSFQARSSRDGTAKAHPPEFSADRYQIDAALDSDLRLKATTRISIKTGTDPLRVLPFEISRAIEISAARIDGQAAELVFRNSSRDRALRVDENDPFLVIAPSALAPGSAHVIEFDQEGSVISSSGRDVYFVGARSNWYPRGTSDFAVYDLAFRYPKRLTLVTAGEVIEDRVDGDWRYTRRATSVPIRLAGFNLGDYEKVVSPVAAPGFHIEVYGNKVLEASLQPKLQATDTAALPAATAPPPRRRMNPPLQTPIPPIPLPPPDPAARSQTVAADVSFALQLFSGWFGPPPLKSLTISPIPGTFGQGFPGLIYLSTLAYLDPYARPAPLRGPREQVFFSDLIEAHEVAHQWWGGVVLPATYQDDWMSEALANYSALLYLEKKKGPRAMQEVLEDYRDTLMKTREDGSTVESAGPITLGYRLGDADDIWHTITYDKGAWIIHMLRRRLGDERFFKMLGELRRRYDSRVVSTADLRALAKEFLPPRMRESTMDEFFDNWVYSTGVPSLKMTYSVKGAAPAVRLSIKIEQSGVDDDFSVEAPVEVQFANGTPQTIWVQTSNGGATYSTALKQVPTHVSIPAGTGILAARK